MAQPTDKNACAANSEDCSIPGYPDINSYTQEALKTSLQGVKASNELPASGDDHDYYSSFPGFRTVVQVEGQRLLKNIADILKHQGINVKLTGATEIDDMFDALVDANDAILESVGSSLDEAAGLKKKEQSLLVSSLVPKDAISASWNRTRKDIKATNSPDGRYKLLSARNILRPQLKFKEKVDNRNLPFVPQLKIKHNAMQPWHPQGDDDGEDADRLSGHPYQFELNHLQFLPSQLEKMEPRWPESLEDTPLTYVSSYDELVKLKNTLKQEQELAVDLEAHSYRTFLGITCLMQLSTRTEDFIVRPHAALELRSDIHILNEIFSDPSIIKVFHGADMDIRMLQRDFSVYVVNMFDTGQASRVLGLARHSLQHLLRHYCSVEADKQYQLADWRIRPLPAELLKYAREDTHYLLYVYDVMKNELLLKGNSQKNLLLSALQKSKQICELVYEKPLLLEYRHLELYKRSKKQFNNRQLAALKSLYAWRDHVCRVEDESTSYVLPNHMLLQVAEVLPREMQGILACCNPIPTLVRQQLNELHQIILRARQEALVKISTIVAPVKLQVEDVRFNPDSLFNCPHDLSHGDLEEDASIQSEPLLGQIGSAVEFVDDVAPSISNKKRSLPRKAKIGVFANETGLVEDELRIGRRDIHEVFVSPYQRFKATQPLKQNEKDEENKAEKAGMTPFEHIQKMNQQFRTPVTSEIDVEKEKAIQSEAEAARKIKEQKTEDIVESHIKSLREQMASKKKKRPATDLPFQSGSVSQSPNVSTPKAKRSKTDEAGPQTDTLAFSPYDYSKTDMSVFRSGGSSKSRSYDPYAEGHEKNRGKI
ncbi:PREDICTED: LOW QUALITY PROTEIN: exosome component 10-like [Priapulus caudatus]|uniref:LOW QUALITY PROTEIN: exosome component 10-like n=1 Tax=Priapulus caudatus TaxID=37621 RepID=A0ABM1ESM3_PRICU|nr:PREDICTED: LOW QUALITY PROTEIN: exosome component 10-like [Priapulus caudatus]